MTVTKIDYQDLPESLREGARRWIEQGIPPGGFLRAVIANDLYGAIVQQGTGRMIDLIMVVRWWHDEAPAACFGSGAAALEWESRHMAASGPDRGDTGTDEASARTWLAQCGVIVEDVRA